jgi:Zn/Cd-binding protein ZinT
MSEENKKPSKWQKREIGALWKNEGRNQKYLAGHIKNADGTEQKVVIFSNKNRSNDKAPHFRVYKSEDQKAQPDSTETSMDDLSSDSSDSSGSNEDSDLI